MSEFFEAIWAYIKRRGAILSMSLVYSFTTMPMVSGHALPRCRHRYSCLYRARTVYSDMCMHVARNATTR